MSDTTDLKRLAEAADAYDPPWLLVTADLPPSAKAYMRALHPSTVLALLAERDALLAVAEAMRRHNRDPHYWCAEGAEALAALDVLRAGEGTT